MRAHRKTLFEAEFQGPDIEVFKTIIKLAADRLRTSPVTRLHGSPHVAQAGIKATDLIRVKTMITELSAELGMEKPDLEPKLKAEFSNDALDAILLSVLGPALFSHMFGSPANQRPGGADWFFGHDLAAPST